MSEYACLFISPTRNVKKTSKGQRKLHTHYEMRYLGLFIVQSHIFRYSLDHAKRSFYRAENGIFGKIGRTASEEVVFELIKTKCLPILLYGLEACPLNKTNLRSLDFSVNRFFMKLFTRTHQEMR